MPVIAEGRVGHQKRNQEGPSLQYWNTNLVILKRTAGDWYIMYMKFFIIITSTQSINKFRYRRRSRDTSKSPQPAHHYRSATSEAFYHQMNIREAHRRRWKVF